MEVVRILHVLGKLNRGGAETLVMNWYRNIDRTKIQFDFVIHTTEKCSYTDEIYSLGGRIYSMPAYNGINHLHYRKVWHHFFKSHREYYIIHGHVRSTAIIYLHIAKQYGCRVISHSHSINSGQGFKGMVKSIMQYPIRYIADYQWACSWEAGKYLFGANSVKNSRFKIVKNAIDLEKFSYDKQIRKEMRSCLGLEGKFVVGHIGRFIPEKNHEFIVEVFEQYHNRNNDAILLLVGIGSLMTKIKAKVAQKGLESCVLFMGERTDISDIMQAMDVFLFPSTYEGLGIVAIEAQTSGLPVLLSETIPNEVKVIDNAWFLPIDKTKSYDIWKNKLLELDSMLIVRENTQQKMSEAGYNIVTAVCDLIDEYMSIINAER